jgi:hypothetical protein
MFKLSLQELIALDMVLKNTTVKELLEAAALSFANTDSDNETICIKAVDTFLR